MTPHDLVAIELICRLKYAYLRLLDEKRWDELARLLTADAIATFDDSATVFAGRDTIVDQLRQAFDRPHVGTVHRATQPEIDVAKAGRATGVWAIDDHRVDHETQLISSHTGICHDDYRKTDGRWLIAATAYTRRTVHTIESTGTQPVDAAAAADWWTRRGD